MGLPAMDAALSNVTNAIFLPAIIVLTVERSRLQFVLEAIAQPLKKDWVGFRGYNSPG